MPYCRKCGAEFPNDTLYCPKCGFPTELAQKTGQAEDTTQWGKTIQRKGIVYGVVNLENLPPGYVIDERYEIKAKIGQGGFGAVYRAYDRRMQIDKAIKVIPEALTNDVVAMDNLRQEARTMIRLKHPNIVHVYDLHEGKISYIDMEFIDGVSLAEYRISKPEKRLSEDEVKQIALQILDGLSYAHKQNVIHRDIKPQNIMISKGDSPNRPKIKIMDFGIAETLRTSMSMIQNTSTTGTLVYMAPEQLRGAGISRRSDIYSLGATLYELLNGKPPFYTGDVTYQILNEEPKPLPHVSETMNKILLTCLQKDQSKRFHDCEAMKKALETGKIEIGAKREVKLDKSTKKEGIKRNGAIKWIMMAAIIVAFIGVGIFLVKKHNEVDFSKIYWIYIEGSTFEMGSTLDGNNDIIKAVKVDDFYMSKYEITNAQFCEFLNNQDHTNKDVEKWIFINNNNCKIEYSNGRYYPTRGYEGHPVVEVTWYGANAFCKWISKKTGKTIRLPSESEWEYAARGGKKSKNYKYAGSNDANLVAWYSVNSDGRTHQVGKKKPNELGLYDMSGNVWEWCSNWHYISTAGFGAIRSGSWKSISKELRITHSSGYNPSFGASDIGFRLVMTR